MGATLTTMLLGHHYLTAPTMTIKPLQRAVSVIGSALGGRCLLAGLGVWFSTTLTAGVTPAALTPDSQILLAGRWGMGFVGAALALYLTGKTVRIRSTQAATGMLYVTTIFVFFGELASMIHSRGARIL
jgi:hypothetical protein